MKRAPSFFATFLRTLAIAAAVAATAASGAFADQRAEAFVTEHANEALAVLSDNSMSLSEKKATFRDLVDEVADVPKITRFVLGRYARSIDPATMSEFSDVFRDYAIGVYEERLSDYAGETLEVTGSSPVSGRDGDFVVHSVVSGGGQEDDLNVNWRVLIDESGQAQVVDVEVYGVWLAVNQREEIVGIINTNRGSIQAAIDALRRRISEQEMAS
ncbi:MAG: ABC transporter substrate-binding protein [Maricaulaceae bacterium]|jgi:phospholipid transport system substrate-binding protein